MVKKLHFKDKEKYEDYLKYGNYHHLFKHKPPYEEVFIGGHKHKVKHTKK